MNSRYIQHFDVMGFAVKDWQCVLYITSKSVNVLE